MKFDPLYNFISPVTGRLPLKTGYTFIGDEKGYSYQSPIFFDISQDIIDLRHQINKYESLDKLTHNRIWIGDFDNDPVERLQIGIINLPALAEAVFPNPLSPITGDFRIPNPTFDYLSPFDWVMSGPFLPQIYATKYDTFGNPVGTDVSSSLAMTQVRAAQIMKRFDNANFIVGSSTVDFNWENPKMYLIPEPLKQLYGLGTTYTFRKAQSLGNLETGLLKNTVADSIGTLSKAISGEDYVNTADFPIGSLTILDPLYPLSGHKLIAPTTSKIRKNTPNEFGKVVDTVDVLETDYVSTKNLSVKDVAPNSLIKLNALGELAASIPAVDLTDLLTTVSILDKWLLTVTGINKIAGATIPTATKVTDIITSIGDVSSPAINAFAKTSSIVSTATEVATTASLQAQVAALTAAIAGVQAEVTATAAMSAIGNVLNFTYTSLIGAVVGGTSENYIERSFVEKKPLFSENKYYETDDLGLYGKGNIWYDCDGSSSNDLHRGGLRVTAWDSSWFTPIPFFDNDLVPLSIGVFGYKWTAFSNPKLQQGFVWEAEYENSSSDANYRFPKKFSLRDVGHAQDGLGWNIKDNELMNYDLYQDKFNFNKVVKFNKNVILTASTQAPSDVGSLFLHKVNVL